MGWLSELWLNAKVFLFLPLMSLSSENIQILLHKDYRREATAWSFGFCTICLTFFCKHILPSFVCHWQWWSRHILPATFSHKVLVLHDRRPQVSLAESVAGPHWSIAYCARSCAETTQLLRHYPLTLIESTKATAHAVWSPAGIGDHKRMRLLLRLRRITCS